MNLNKLAYAVASARATLTQAEEAYADLCEKYLAAGGQTVVVESLSTKLNVITPKKANIDSEALTKHLIRLGKGNALAKSVSISLAKLALATDKAFAAKMEAKFGNEEDGKPFIKVTAA